MATTSNKRKKAVVATVAAAALMLGGTFAWTSISQQALNESAGIVNVGGRLHDDFNGENKDVYVENFTDPLDGGQPIYARVKLTEYMEVGQEAGGTDVDNDGLEATPVLNGTVRDEVNTWKIHTPETDCERCELGDTCVIHDHWTWTMGGQGDNGGQTTYMPTFNKDKDSLAADINGTYDGTVAKDKVYYDDYVVYGEGGVTSVDGTAYYDNDTDTEDEPHLVQAGNEDENHKAVAETHYAKETAEATVITMTEWKNDYDSAPGNYWVYDTDGWAYWANPIMPGEATGLLLDGIQMTKNPGEKCYYAINVVAQFATVGDWDYFHPDDGTSTESDISDNARDLLQQAANVVPVVTVERIGDANLNVGDSVSFKAQTTFGSTATAGLEDFNWKVFDADLDAETTSTFVDNDDGTATMTVGEGAAGKNLIVAAYAKDYPGAVGLSSLAVEGGDMTAPTLDTEYNTKMDVVAIVGGLAGEDFPITVSLHKAEDDMNCDYNLEPLYEFTINSIDWGNNAVDSSEEWSVQFNVVENGKVSCRINPAEFYHENYYFGIKVTDASGNFVTSPRCYEGGELIGCFAAGTQVSTADGLVNIEDIKLGDMVYSVNMETGKKELAQVTWVQEYRITPDTYTIYAGGEEIVTTYEHPFYVVEKQDFVAAKDLKVGDTLKGMNGEDVVIENIVYEELDEPIQVYNFTVDGNHNYLITNAELLVHNIQK